MDSASGQMSWYMPNPIDISPHADSLKVFGVFANAFASLSMIMTTSTQKPKYVAILIIISVRVGVVKDAYIYKVSCLGVFSKNETTRSWKVVERERERERELVVCTNRRHSQKKA
jgi:hypothetical protein